MYDFLLAPLVCVCVCVCVRTCARVCVCINECVLGCVYQECFYTIIIVYSVYTRYQRKFRYKSKNINEYMKLHNLGNIMNIVTDVCTNSSYQLKHILV